MAKQVIANVSGGVRPSVTVVYADEGTERTGLDLALVFENLVGLNDGHGEITGGIFSDVAEPEQAVSAFSPGECAPDNSDGIQSISIAPERLPTKREQIHQCKEHTTSLGNPNPKAPNAGTANLAPILRI